MVVTVATEDESLSGLVAQDMVGVRRGCLPTGRELDAYASRLAAEAEKLKFAYTAFDGDHQMFCSFMRRRVIAQGLVPANPDSVLGYKDTVLARQTKEGVLLDDLSVLRGCDELWVFTETPILLERICELAEGVLVELLYFLRRYPDRVVRFVSIESTVLCQVPSELKEFKFCYDEVVEALAADQREDVLRLANRGVEVDRRLRTLTYYLIDPLDYKYARFVREGGYDRDICPLVPYLAVRPEDFLSCESALADAVVHWAKLMKLAGKCVRLPRLDAAREPSQLVSILERVWLRSSGSSKIVEESWESFRVPKANQRERWAITAKERASYGKC